MTTTTKAVGHDGYDDKAPVVRLATDHMLEPTLSFLTGSDVELTGRKADGSPYFERRLRNVSFVPARGDRVLVTGLDRDAGGVRQFDLGGVTRMLVELPGSSEMGRVGGGDVHTTAHVSFTSEDLRPLLEAVRGHR